jgi:nitrate reductase gamma subunit
MGVTQLLLYLCFVIFVVVTIARVVRYARSPVHVRWELYPVAHEKGRHEHGGSFFEESQWWEKPREIDHVNEAREMAREIFLLNGVRRNNRGLWTWSLPFHSGLYVLVGWMGLLIVGAVLQLAGVGPDNGFFRLVRGVTTLAGYVGLALTCCGALGLLVYRARDRDMRKFNTPADYIGLIWFAAAALLGLIAYAAQDPSFDQLRGFVASVVSFRAAAPLNPLVAAAVAVGAVLIAYIPLTRMIHFAAKYFLYHDVRWSDEPLRTGSKLEARVKAALDYGVSWDAPHIQKGKTWAEVATEEPE